MTLTLTYPVVLEYNEHVPEFAEFRRPWWRRVFWKPWIALETRPAYWSVGDRYILNTRWRQ